MKKNEFKRLSYAERMSNPEASKYSCKKHPIEYMFAVEEQELFNGRIVKRRKFKKVDQNEYLSQFKVSDFCLENLQACGAIANLTSVRLDGGKINAIDSVVSGLDQLDSISVEE